MASSKVGKYCGVPAFFLKCLYALFDFGTDETYWRKGNRWSSPDSNFINTDTFHLLSIGFRSYFTTLARYGLGNSKV